MRAAVALRADMPHLFAWALGVFLLQATALRPAALHPATVPTCGFHWRANHELANLRCTALRPAHWRANPLPANLCRTALHLAKVPISPPRT